MKETKKPQHREFCVMGRGAIYICEVSGEFVDGELIFTYILGRKGLVAEKIISKPKNGRAFSCWNSEKYLTGKGCTGTGY